MIGSFLSFKIPISVWLTIWRLKKSLKLVLFLVWRRIKFKEVMVWIGFVFVVVLIVVTFLALLLALKTLILESSIIAVVSAFECGFYVCSFFSFKASLWLKYDSSCFCSSWWLWLWCFGYSSWSFRAWFFWFASFPACLFFPCILRWSFYFCSFFSF